MKKLFLFLVAMISCLYSFGQGVSLEEAMGAIRRLYGANNMGISNDFYINDKTQDVAYEAPNSALTKKWFFRPVNHFVNFDNGYIIFNSNGTFKMCSRKKDYDVEYQGRWQRSKQTLKMTFNFGMTKCVTHDLSGYSLREKDRINQERQNAQANFRKLGTKTEVRPIRRLDEFMVLDVGDESVWVCGYLVSEEYVINKIKAAKEEEARKAEEAKKREAEEAARAAKEAEEIRTGTKIYNIDEVEKKPSFPGDKLYMYWVSDNVKYPEAAKKIDESNKYSNMKMKVRARFVIERDGSISNIEIIYNQGTEFYGEEIGRMFSDEAIRVLNSMPKWIPGEQNGASARVRITFCPIEFKY